MVVDSSALVAILQRETGHELLLETLDRYEAIVPAPLLLECFLVTCRTSPDFARASLQSLLDQFSVTELPFSSEHRRAAEAAFERYGKGRHPARLNFGDCMAYAVAKVEGRPLLFVGEDFAKTDVVSALV